MLNIHIIWSHQKCWWQRSYNDYRKATATTENCLQLQRLQRQPRQQQPLLYNPTSSNHTTESVKECYENTNKLWTLEAKCQCYSMRVKSALNNSVNKCHLDTFTVNTNNLAIYEINSALLNINKSTDRRQQKRSFAMKQQAPSIQHQRENLSIQLLEIIQIILFMMMMPCS